MAGVPEGCETVMFGLGITELFILIVLLVILGVPTWLSARVLTKAGLSRWWAFTQIVPGLNFVMIWVFAFSRWPAENAISEVGAPDQ